MKTTLIILVALALFVVSGCSSGCQEMRFLDEDVKEVKGHTIEAHVESEDNWAAFKVDDDFGADRGDLTMTTGWNPLLLEGNELNAPDNIKIKGVNIKLLNVSYDQNGREFADVCIG